MPALLMPGSAGMFIRSTVRLAKMRGSRSCADMGPGVEAVHALRTSEVGGMGHAGEFETSFQLATRPEFVKMDRLEGVYAPLVGWDLVAPVEPSRTYRRRPAPESNHASIFGGPHRATVQSGRAFD